jgi:hypothetical protein
VFHLSVSASWKSKLGISAHAELASALAAVRSRVAALGREKFLATTIASAPDVER